MMSSIYIQSLFYAIVSYLVTYAIGHTLIAFLRIPAKHPFLKEFTKLCVGFYSIITLYSLYQTRGITINTGLILICLFLLYWLRKNNYLNTWNEAIKQTISFSFLPYLFFELIILLISFLYLYLKIKDPFVQQTYIVNGDFYSYGTVIEHLNKTGIEGFFFDWKSGIDPPRTLYHFGDHWYAAFYTWITGQNAFFTFYFQLFSHSLVVYFLGACALIEVFIQPKSKLFYFNAIAILVLCGLSFYIPRNTLFTRGDWWDTGLISQPKYLFPAIFVFYSFIFIRFQKIIPIILIALAVVIVCTVAAPAILISIGIYLLYLITFHKITLNNFIRYSLIILSVCIFLGIYTWWIHIINDKNTLPGTFPTHPVSFSGFYYFKTLINSFAGQVIKSLLSLLPYLLLFFIAMWKNIKNNFLLAALAVLFIIIHISSIVAYAIFSNLFDAVQLWTIVYVPLTCIVIFLMMGYLFSQDNLVVKILVIVLFIFSVKQAAIFTRGPGINEKFTSEVRKIYDGSTMVYFKAKEDFTSFFTKNINMYGPCGFLKMYYKEYNPICLTYFEIPKSETEVLRRTEDEYIANSSFYKFVQLQKINHQYTSIEQSQLDFIKKFNVRFAFTFPNSKLPKSVVPLVLSSVTDSTGKITLYTLKEI
ncbi:MAG: hypothetical protein JWN78_597 [Bacteroidota bacterium]|nr:hypothetical protein [Bacteroidota bacterium]